MNYIHGTLYVKISYNKVVLYCIWSCHSYQRTAWLTAFWWCLRFFLRCFVREWMYYSITNNQSRNRIIRRTFLMRAHFTRWIVYFFMKLNSYANVFIGKINEIHISNNEKSNREILGFLKNIPGNISDQNRTGIPGINP